MTGDIRPRSLPERRSEGQRQVNQLKETNLGKFRVRVLALLCAVAMIAPTLAGQTFLPVLSPLNSPVAGQAGMPVLLRAQEAAAPATAASPTVNRAELYQALLDLTNPYTVMCVAAHPDDEDGTTLTVLRRKHGVHTVSLFSTYGEGGQNAVGPELYEQLGVIRAQETKKAALIQGSEPYFLGMKDFGFSKSAEEAC
jgi:hypothetical protein